MTTKINISNRQEALDFVDDVEYNIKDVYKANFTGCKRLNILLHKLKASVDSYRLKELTQTEFNSDLAGIRKNILTKIN